jgi:hypothetical protein
MDVVRDACDLDGRHPHECDAIRRQLPSRRTGSFGGQPSNPSR